MLGAYIHIPFCASKCFYCDFYSCINKTNAEEYIETVIKEIMSEAELLSVRGLNTIYIGGGTPSVIDSKYIIKLLDVIRMFAVENAEITIEINPESVTEQKLQDYFNAGVNRISIGLQSANDETLKKIGRRATLKDFEKAYYAAVKVGFKNISCDVIIGLPDETLGMFEKTVDYVLGLKYITHISAYSLEVHENTKLDFLVSNNFVTLPDEHIERDMKYMLDSKLQEHRFYEI